MCLHFYLVWPSQKKLLDDYLNSRSLHCWHLNHNRFHPQIQPCKRIWCVRIGRHNHLSSRWSFKASVLLPWDEILSKKTPRKPSITMYNPNPWKRKVPESHTPFFPCTFPAPYLLEWKPVQCYWSDSMGLCSPDFPHRWSTHIAYCSWHRLAIRK